VSTKNQIIFARVNLNIINGHCRQIGFEPQPVRSLINRNEQSEFCSDEKQILISRMLADYVNALAIGNRLPANDFQVSPKSVVT